MPGSYLQEQLNLMTVEWPKYALSFLLLFLGPESSLPSDIVLLYFYLETRVELCKDPRRAEVRVSSLSNSSLPHKY